MKIKEKTFLITGSAGFIGFHLSKKLLELGHNIYGIDNLDDYYDSKIKKDRNKILKKFSNYIFYKSDLCKIENLSINKIDIIIHFAAQPGIHLSEDNREKYFNNNILASFKLLEFMKKNNLKKIIYASSSSVYSGNNNKVNSEHDSLNIEKNFYATTKKINETLISYYQKKGISSIGLRFFTVFGPFGRPDMLMSKIMSAYKNNGNLKLYNKGNNKRDFTFIDDAILSTYKILENFLKENKIKQDIFNIGFGKSVTVKEVISIFEKNLDFKFKKKLLPSNSYENLISLANTVKFKDSFGNFHPNDLEYGIREYITWYKNYYKIK